jgi:hypothetical protein
MKNQNDLICIVGCSLVAIIATVIMFFMKREPVQPAAPTAVLTATPTFPGNTQPAMASSLSGGSSSAGGFGGMMGGRGMGPGMGMGMGRGGAGVGPGGPPPGVGGPPAGIPGGARGKRSIASG